MGSPWEAREELPKEKTGNPGEEMVVSNEEQVLFDAKPRTPVKKHHFSQEKAINPGEKSS